MPCGVYNRTKEHNQKISLALKGCIAWNKNLTKDSDERVKKISDKLKNRRLSNGMKRKISDSLKGKNAGKKLSEKTKEKIRIARIGKKFTKETRERMSISHKNIVFSEDHKKNISKAKKGVKFSDVHKQKLSESNTKEIKQKRVETRKKNGWFKDIEEVKRRQKEAKRGCNPWNHFKNPDIVKEKIRNTLKGHPCYKSEERKKNISKAKTGGHLSEITKKKMSATRQGIQLKDWTEFLSPIRSRIYQSKNFDVWRRSIFQRDDWTCQDCYIKGGSLHAHHIRKFSKYPLLRFDVDNGITLCKPCHEKTIGNEEDYIEYFNKKLL